MAVLRVERARVLWHRGVRVERARVLWHRGPWQPAAVASLREGHMTGAPGLKR